MKIVIVYGWHDDNKGDSAIVKGSIKILRQAFPNANFVIIPINQALSERRAYRHLLKDFSEILTIEQSSYPSSKKSKLGYLKGVLKSWFGMVFRNPTLPDLKSIASADLVVCKGGHILHTEARKTQLRAMVAMLQYAYWPVLAIRYGKPVVFLGHSLGPFYGSIDRMIASYILRKLTAVFVREAISAKTAVKLGVPVSKIKLIPDLAFALKPLYSPAVESIIKKHGLKSGNFAVITVRQWFANQSRFIQEMAELVRGLLRESIVKKVAIVVHTTGPTFIEDDHIASRELYQLLQNENNIVLIDYDLSPEEMIALYGEAKLLVGTRFHSVIFASIAGTPAYAISYVGPKAEGIMEMMSVQHLVQDIHTFSAEKALTDIKSQDFTLWRAQIQEKVKGLHEQLEELVPLLRSLVNGGEAWLR